MDHYIGTTTVLTPFYGISDAVRCRYPSPVVKHLVTDRFSPTPIGIRSTKTCDHFLSTTRYNLRNLGRIVSLHARSCVEDMTERRLGLDLRPTSTFFSKKKKGKKGGFSPDNTHTDRARVGVDVVIGLGLWQCFNRGAWDKKNPRDFHGLRRHFRYGSLKVFESGFILCPMKCLLRRGHHERCSS